MFQHFLITRFNLRNLEWVATKSKQPTLTDDWLRDRFVLFDKFCFPCVKAQTNQAFIWLIYFDATTPTIWREKIAAYAREMPNLQPRFIDGMQSFLPSIQADIASSTSPYLITTRIDNDDAVSCDFIDAIQHVFEPQAYLPIDFIDGYCLQWQPTCLIGNMLRPHNPFMTLIEENKAPQSVFHRAHPEWKRVRTLKRVRHQKIWMSIIHEENVFNTFKGFGKVDMNDIRRRFPLPLDCYREIEQRLQAFNTWRWKSMKNYIHSLVKLFRKDIKHKLRLYR